VYVRADAETGRALAMETIVFPAFR
jgi:hypothetical protein